jgi:hypothetical protein
MKPFPQQSAHLEFHRPMRRNMNTLERFRILGRSTSSHTRLEYTKIPELQPIISAKFGYNLIQKSLDNVLHQDSFGLRIL